MNEETKYMICSAVCPECLVVKCRHAYPHRVFIDCRPEQYCDIVDRDVCCIEFKEEINV